MIDVNIRLYIQLSVHMKYSLLFFFSGMADRLLFQVIPYNLYRISLVESRLSEVDQVGTTDVCSISKYAVYRVYLRLSHPYFSPFRRRVSLFAWLSKISVNCYV